MGRFQISFQYIMAQQATDLSHLYQYFKSGVFILWCYLWGYIQTGINLAHFVTKSDSPVAVVDQVYRLAPVESYREKNYKKTHKKSRRLMLF